MKDSGVAGGKAASAGVSFFGGAKDHPHEKNIVVGRTTALHAVARGYRSKPSRKNKA
jgi:hypothetical protein